MSAYRSEPNEQMDAEDLFYYDSVTARLFATLLVYHGAAQAETVANLVDRAAMEMLKTRNARKRAGVSNNDSIL